MNKRIVIPVVLCAVIILIVSKCVSGGNKISLKWSPVATSEVDMDSLSLKVFVENSGSMDAYMCPGSNLKDAVFDYVSDLSRITSSCSLYYINSKVIPYSGNLGSYIKNLTPQSFAMSGGDRSNTDLMQMLETIVKYNGKRTISVFVSDCILDISGNTSDYLGRCQVSVKNTFNEALAKNPYLGVEIIKLESRFSGWWFCGENREYLENARRPYYIWVIGDQRYLAEFNKKVPVENIIGGIKEYCAYAPAQSIPFDIEKKNYVVNHTDKVNVELLVNLERSLQDRQTIGNTGLYKSANPAQVSIVSVNEISNSASKYSHVINLEIENPKTLKSESVSFTCPNLPKWLYDTDDTTGKNVKDNINRTTGLMALVKGVAEAYKNSSTYGNVTFEIKNK